MSKLLDAIQKMMAIPGVLGVVLVDADGIPLAVEGDFDLPPEDVGAILATCFESFDSLGRGMGEFHVESLVAEYTQIKIVQQRVPRGTIIVVAEKPAPVGILRLEAKRSLAHVTQQMESNAEVREKFMQQNKLRLSQTEGSDGSCNARQDLLEFLHSQTKKTNEGADA